MHLPVFVGEPVGVAPPPVRESVSPEPAPSGGGEGYAASVRISPNGSLCLDGFTSPMAGIADDSLGISPSRGFLYSAIVPGAAQWQMEQWRWAGYVALEAAAWIGFWDNRRSGSDLRRRYRDLAWFVARSNVYEGQRTDGDFEYYETLSRFRASGAFDSDPFRVGIQPEPDSSTFNGSIWALAREIFFPAMGPTPEPGSPEFMRALEFYRARGYRPEMAWDWGNRLEDMEDFTNLITRSDDRLRRSTTMIGLVIANHLFSAVDGFISARLRQEGAVAGSVRLRAVPDLIDGGWRLEARLSPP